MLVDVEAFKLYVRNELGDLDTAILTGALLAAESAVNNDCHRVFTVADDTATERRYVGSGRLTLAIHDCAEIDSVDDNGTGLVDGTDFQAEPLNNLDDAGDYRPFDLLRRSTIWYADVSGFATVTVTARWGWAEIPSPVTEAIKILAKDIAANRDVRLGVAGFGEFGAVRVRQNLMVATLIEPYRAPNSYRVG